MDSAVFKRIADRFFTESGFLQTDSLICHQEVRKLCEANTCRNYGTSWACPPAVGTLEECAQRVKQYSTMLLLSRKYEIQDSFDFEGMHDALLNFKQVMDDFEAAVKPHTYQYLLLSNEGCGRCRKCTYPDAPCRFPDKLHHSLEGYGYIVSELATKAGIRYNNGPNTVTFFGALLFNQSTT